MCAHVCPWWGGYFIDNPLRRLFHDPDRILAPYVQPGVTALDFGCGMGIFAIAMAKLVGDGGRVIAVDLQQKMLDVVSKRATRAGLSHRLRIHHCQTDSIGLDEPIDFALAFYSAHEVPDLERLLAELRRLLRPTGKLLVVEPVGHVTADDFQHMLALAGGVGLEVQERPQVCLSRGAVLVPRQPG